MIPFFQLDPATLTFWYNVDLLGDQPHGDELTLICEAALLGRDDQVVARIKAAPEHSQPRLAAIASAIWHEKRHFLDFLITNYGAFRFRQFVEIYANIAPALNYAINDAGGRLIVPIDAYADPIRLRKLGIAESQSDGLRRLGVGVRDRKRMIADDRRRFRSRLGMIEVGGEAQFEALAYLCQAAKLQKLFGLGLVSAAIDAVPDADAHHAKYRWAVDLAVHSGVVFFDTDPFEQKLLLDDALTACLLFAALSSRHWKQVQVRSEAVSSYLPGERLTSLLVGLRDGIANVPRIMLFDEAWRTVNQKAKDLFGRDVVEETEVDWEHGEEYARMLEDRVPDEVHRVIKDYQMLRRRLIDVLNADPAQIVSPAQFNETLLGKLRPMVMSASGRGVLGDPPAGHARIFGYRHPHPQANPEAQPNWVWAWTSKMWPPVEDAGDIMAVSDGEAWRPVVSEFAPIGKLMLNGRRHRTMLGPELIFAEQRLKAQYNIDIMFEKYFEWPEESIRPADYLFLRGTNTAPCDFTSADLPGDQAAMFTKWDLLREPALGHAILEYWQRAGGQDAAYISFLREWSPWYVRGDLSIAFGLEEFRQRLESLSATSPPVRRWPLYGMKRLWSRLAQLGNRP